MHHPCGHHGGKNGEQYRGNPSQQQGPEAGENVLCTVHTCCAGLALMILQHRFMGRLTTMTASLRRAVHVHDRIP